MQKKRIITFASLLGLVALLSALSISAVSAHNQSQRTVSAASASIPMQPAQGYKQTTTNATFAGVVDERKVPQATAGLGADGQSMPFLTGASYSQKKSAAAHNTSAPTLAHAFSTGSVNANVSPAQISFDGQSNSGTTCSYFKHGCQPPDMALATSSKWVLQGVNTSFGVYDYLGNLLAGWPKSFQQFFQIANPPNNCDRHGPFLSDPRAVYDPNDDRFWVAALQIEGALGIGPKCPFMSFMWFAVSQTNDPSGKWNVFFIPENFDGTAVADYTQFGFDNQNVYFNANMFASDGSAYLYDELWMGKKGQFEHPGGITLMFGFLNLQAPDGTLVDTVQPVESETTSPSAMHDALLVSSFNINSGGGSCINGCSGVILWAIKNPDSFQAQLEEAVVPTGTYALAPNADQPNCAGCIETLDTRISATPVYHNGLVSFALETAAQNSTQVVPAIFWGQILPQIVNGNVQSASLYQSGLFGFEGDQAASFGALMPDNSGDLLMVYDTMGSAVNPGIAYTGHLVNDPLNAFPNAGRFLQMGITATTNGRWGDYEAASFDGPAGNHIWFASEYSNAKGDWSTRIGEDQFR